MFAKLPKAPLGSTRNRAMWTRRDELVARAILPYTELVIAKAQNATLWDMDGRSYVDFAGGLGVLNVGHCHPRVVEALRAQAGKLLHTSFHVAAYEGYLDVCDKLINLVPGPGPKKVALFNSGSEAVENAVKFARAFTKRPGVISFDNGFHGATLLCVTLDGKYKPLRQGFGPPPAEIYHSRFPNPYRAPRGIPPEALVDHCLDEIERLFLTDIAAEDVAAIIVEPIQGEGGVIVPPRGFLAGLRSLCDREGILLIIDEVQTGFGRTGRFWAMEHEEVTPDLVTVGKALGAGLPISAVVGRADILDSPATGSIGGTFGGNPMACAAALEVFKIIEDENLIAAASKIGRELEARFDRFLERYPVVGDSRGSGAMWAIELVCDRRTCQPLHASCVKAILQACTERGLVAVRAGTHNNIIRTLMPLTIPEEDLMKGLDILEDVLADFKP